MDPIAEKKQGFWRRMTSSKGPTPTSPPSSFTEFAEGQDDVWGDEVDQFSGMSFSRKDSTGSKASSNPKSRPASATPLPQPQQQQPKQKQQQRQQQQSPPPQPASPQRKSPKKSVSNPDIPNTPPHAAAISKRRSFLTKKEKDPTTEPERISSTGGSRFRHTSSTPQNKQKLQDKTPPPNTPTDTNSSTVISTPSANPNQSRSAHDVNPHRVAKFRKLLTSQNLDLEALRELSFTGITFDERPDTWRLLSGYLPANIDRREATLKRKRAEYRGFVDDYFGTRNDEGEMKKTFHQIAIDIKRTNPQMPSFHNPITHEMFERILYIWAIRHPASGYVQGINELVTPFMTVFLSSFTGNVDECDASKVSEEARYDVEADSYWCLTKLLDGIQDNYVSGQPGIQKKLLALEDLVCRVDKPLHDQLMKHDLRYVQFAFRWMNCILMREVPLKCSIRLWDTYHSEIDGFVSLHMYTCAAFLVTYSEELLESDDFQTMIMMLQKLPTESWTDNEIALMVAKAYSWKVIFHDAKK
eukprot:m.82498 g.82498  ORF g.82498 m.82498 type:complete len:527 (-) comp25522_c0_seq1:153-1733(-)